MPAPKGNVPKRRGVYGWSLLNHIRYMAQKPLYYKPPPYYAAMLAVPPTQGPYRQKKKGKLFFDDDKLRTKLEPRSLWVRRDWRRGNLGYWSYGMNDGGGAIKRIKSLMAQGYSEDDALKIFETEQIDALKRKKKQIQWVSEDQGFTYRDGVEVLRLLKQVKGSSKEDIIKGMENIIEKKDTNHAMKPSSLVKDGVSLVNPQMMRTLHHLNATNHLALKICAARAKLSDMPVYTDLKKDVIVSPFDLFSIYIRAFNITGEGEALETYNTSYYNGKPTSEYMDKLYEEFRLSMAEYMKFSPAALERAMLNTLKEAGLVDEDSKSESRSFVVFEKAGVVPPDFTEVFKRFAQLEWPGFEERMGYFRNRFEYFYAFMKFQEVIGMGNMPETPEFFLDNLSLFKEMAHRMLEDGRNAADITERMKEQIAIAENHEDWSEYRDNLPFAHQTPRRKKHVDNKFNSFLKYFEKPPIEE